MKAPRSNRRGRAVATAVEVLLASALATGLIGCSAEERPPNVVLITLESLRPDHVGCYLGTRPTTPALDAFAEGAVVYERAHAVTSWTLASHASLFTGLYPTAHRAKRPLSRLDEDHETLAEILARAGYECGAVVSGPYLRRAHGLDQGFSFFDESPASEVTLISHDDVTNEGMVRGIERFVSERDARRPFFLFAYFWDPHYDYIPPSPYDTMFVEPGHEPIDVHGYEIQDVVNADISPAQLDYVRSQYDGELRWTDEHLARVFALLREEGLWEDTLVVITSDHGEEFFEHGTKGHKNNIYQESVHVPLVVKYPGAGPRGRDERLVSLVDVLPTVLEVTGVGDASALSGRSLLAPADPQGAVFAELLGLWYIQRPDEPETTRTEEWFAVIEGQRKLIFRPQLRQFELYDLASDPGETHNLAEEQAAAVAALMRRLETWRADQLERAKAFDDDERAKLGAEALERLRSLGYVR